MADDDDVEMADLLAPNMCTSDKILLEMQSRQQENFITDLFSLMASVMRDRVGKIQQLSDSGWDEIVRFKDLHIFVFSMLGVAANIGIACVFWYNDKVTYENGVRTRHDIVLAEASPAKLALLWLLQILLSFTTIITCVLLAQKYSLLMDEKRRLWSGMDTYDLVQSKDNEEAINAWKTSYSIWRSPYRWICIGEIALQLVHPILPMNNAKSATLYELLEVCIFLRLYLSVKLVFSFSDEYKCRHEIVASNVELQRSGFQITMGSTLKMRFFDRPGRFVVTLLILALTNLGFIVFIVERRYQPQTEEFGSLENNLWFAFVTFTTVGYGDLAPKSGFGRLAAFAVGAAGITITTIFGGVVTNLMVQSREQRYVSEYLNIVRAGEQCRDSAARVIQSAWCWYQLRLEHIKTAWRPKGHKSNLVYKAIKKFKSHRWIMSQSMSTANDPVIDSKMTSLMNNLLVSVRVLQNHSKTALATQYNIESYVNDVIRLLEK